MGAAIIGGGGAYLNRAQSWTAQQNFLFNVTVSVTDGTNPFLITGSTYASHAGADVFAALGDSLNVFGGIVVTNHGDLSVINNLGGMINIAPENCVAGNVATLAPISAMAANANWLMPAVDANIAAYNLAQTWTASQSGMTLITPTIASFTNATHNHQNAAGGGALDAAAVTSGVLTADRVYQSVVKITADQSTTSATMANVTGLALAVAASTYYEFEFVMCWKTANVADFPNFQITGPASPTVLSYKIEIADTGSGGFTISSQRAFSQAVGAVAGDTGNNWATIKGLLVNGANAGNIQVQFANGGGSVSVTVKSGAYGKLTKLP